MKTFFLAFHFEDPVNPLLVKYQADEDLRYEIEDCTQAYIESAEDEYTSRQELVEDVMNSMLVSWEFVPYSAIDVG